MKRRNKNILYGSVLFILSIICMFMGFDLLFNDKTFYYIISTFITGFLLGHSMLALEGGLIRRNKYNEIKHDLKILCNNVIKENKTTKDKAIFYKMYHEIK